jgi:signal transduction histidine kinase
MRDQISHYLDRARAAALAGTLGTSTDIASVIAGLQRAFAKIHHDKYLDFDVHVAPHLRFRGEKQDFEDMIGNLTDNACKWAAHKVLIQADMIREMGRARLRISIEDDGPGLPEVARMEVLQRGKRLDETKPGSGLGLSIVAELAGLYGGSLMLDASALGGLAARLDLPGEYLSGE